MLLGMAWERYLADAEPIEDMLTRWREKLPSSARVDRRAEVVDDDELRLFPIVGGDLCLPVASLLARGRLEEAGRLVSDRAWVASTPLYG
jgi:hypothetical protein